MLREHQSVAVMVVLLGVIIWAVRRSKQEDPESQQMVGVGIPIFLVRGDVYFWQSLMAACLIASIPIALLYNLFLNRFIAGFTVGAVKG